MLKRLFLILFLMASVTGCSHIYGDRGVIKNHDTDYLKAQNIDPIKLPPGYSSANIQSHYPVYGPEYPTSSKPVALVPPELNKSGQSGS
jgi:uncharacterized lipoprotein